MEKINCLDAFKTIKNALKKHLVNTIEPNKVFKVYKQKNSTAAHCLFSGQSFVNYNGEIRAVNKTNDGYIISQKHDLVDNLINTLLNAADNEYYIDYKVEQTYILSEESRKTIKCLMDLGVKEFKDYKVVPEYEEVKNNNGVVVNQFLKDYSMVFLAIGSNLQGKYIITSKDNMRRELYDILKYDILTYDDIRAGMSLEVLYNAKKDVEFIMEETD